MTDTMPAQTQRTIDPDKLMSFVFRAVDEVGATLNTALVVMGDKLGYYTAMADGRPVTPAELAERTGTSEHYAREWLNNQAAGAIVEYDPQARRYTLPAEHAVALADPTSPAYLAGFFQLALGTVHDAENLLQAARDGVPAGTRVGCDRSDILRGDAPP